MRASRARAAWILAVPMLVSPAGANSDHGARTSAAAYSTLTLPAAYDGCLCEDCVLQYGVWAPPPRPFRCGTCRVSVHAVDYRALAVWGVCILGGWLLYIAAGRYNTEPQGPDEAQGPGRPSEPVEPVGPICIHCGYDLTGLRAARCPECGETVPPGAGRPPP
ncbi:MAG: hypothetical protein SFY69_05640 [Planctomycetota bacterium]|nr:hypothetical protein [Planctomycetota bacterium]